MTLFFDAEGYTSPTLDEQPTKSLLYVPINLGQLYGINSTVMPIHLFLT